MSGALRQPFHSLSTACRARLTCSNWCSILQHMVLTKGAYPTTDSGQSQAWLEDLAQRVRPVTLAGEQLLPVPRALESLLPDRGLRRGGTVAVHGSLALALVLVAGASAAGSWVVAVGLPDLGVVAAAEAGIVLERLALVPGAGPAAWASVVAALLDAIDVVLVRPPARLPPPWPVVSPPGRGSAGPCFSRSAMRGPSHPTCAWLSQQASGRALARATGGSRPARSRSRPPAGAPPRWSVGPRSGFPVPMPTRALDRDTIATSALLRKKYTVGSYDPGEEGRWTSRARHQGAAFSSRCSGWRGDRRRCPACWRFGALIGRWPRWACPPLSRWPCWMPVGCSPARPPPGPRGFARANAGARRRSAARGSS